jgi:hypothetical protein
MASPPTYVNVHVAEGRTANIVLAGPFFLLGVISYPYEFEWRGNDFMARGCRGIAAHAPERTHAAMHRGSPCPVTLDGTPVHQPGPRGANQPPRRTIYKEKL